MQGIKCVYHNAVGSSGPLGKGCSLQNGLAFISVTRVTPCRVGCAEGEISAFSTRVKEWEGTGYI